MFPHQYLCNSYFCFIRFFNLSGGQCLPARFNFTAMELTHAQIENNLLSILQQVERTEPFVYPLFECLYHLGVRAQEATNPRLWSWANPDTVILQPQKWNDKRIFQKSEVPEKFQLFLRNYPNFPYYPNYSRLNYLYSLFSIYPNIYIGQKKSTLHLFRHAFVKRLLASGKQPHEIKSLLAERNQKSADAYINSIFTTNPQID